MNNSIPYLSAAQLEEKANELLRQFDSERLNKCKPLDVYEVIEKCLDVPYDWKYITPDQSVLGMTAFNSGWIWVWPEPSFENGKLPLKLDVAKGTIIIDSTLTEKPDRGAENFTVIHEVFHHVLHKEYFEKETPDYLYGFTPHAGNQRKKLKTPLDRCEYQANACAAAFLMPKLLLCEKVDRHSSKLDLQNHSDAMFIKDIAEEFNVSVSAMKNRLNNLGRIK